MNLIHFSVSRMAAILAKRFGWTYSQTIQVISQNGLWKAYMSKASQFVGKERRQQVQKQKQRYLNRINSLDPDHDLDLPGK